MHQSPFGTRRDFLKTAALLSASPAITALAGVAPRPKVAMVFTSFFYRSHAHVILENFLEPYLFNGQKTDPGCDVVSLYGDQFNADDMGRDVAKQYGIPIYDSIAGALCRGGKDLAVDAVLSIGEHGNYPVNEWGQTEYPRKRFFDEIVAVMKRSQRFVPLFNDKHLSYRWDWAREMYDTARELQIPFMAGSSVPLAERRPPLELPPSAEIAQAVTVHGGPLESYDFHGIELLQSLVEARKGGETGIRSVEFFAGEAFDQLVAADGWRELIDAALAAELGKAPESLAGAPGAKGEEPHAIRLIYVDGLTALVVKYRSLGSRWNFACRLKGEEKPRATHFYVGPWNNRNLFKALSHAIQTHFIQKKSPYPVERTLLATGALEAVLRARRDGKRLETPHLEIAYAPIDFRAMREMGATWKIVTPETPQPMGIDLTGRNFKPQG
ncbi:MAG: hypothetical protein EHM42_07500 [Planctomycetaceae bacterium]|nr:MAG: hypothetical protein EHM42_07500 [Planctomycetaceae bacterium]